MNLVLVQNLETLGLWPGDWVRMRKGCGKAMGLKVCVVEDDQELTTVIEQVFRSIDPDVSMDWATSAEEALYYLKSSRLARPHEKPYDLILADIFLEGTTTGIELWQLCQREYPGILLILTSGLTADQFVGSLGSNEICPPFMQKPFSAGECKETLQGILRYAAHDY